MSSSDIVDNSIDVSDEKLDAHMSESSEIMAVSSRENSIDYSQESHSATSSCFEVAKEDITPAPTNSQGDCALSSRQLLEEKLKWCGVIKSIKQWATISGIRPETVCSRIRRGMPPENALTTPDREGHFLRALTDEEIQSAFKAERQHRSFTSISWHAEEKVHRARIVAHHRVLNLGEYDSSDEAKYAFNTAIDLLPEEWEESSKEPISQPLSTERTLEIETNVRSLMQDHGETDPDLTLFDFPQDDPHWGVVLS